jgi:hypothetical protein
MGRLQSHDSHTELKEHRSIISLLFSSLTGIDTAPQTKQQLGLMIPKKEYCGFIYDHSTFKKHYQMSKKIVSEINSETKQGEGPKSVRVKEGREKKSAFCKS